MTFKNQQSQAVFDGAVVLTRGTLVVYSDRMVVSFRHQEPADSKKASDLPKGGNRARQRSGYGVESGSQPN